MEKVGATEIDGNPANCPICGADSCYHYKVVIDVSTVNPIQVLIRWVKSIGKKQIINFLASYPIIPIGYSYCNTYSSLMFITDLLFRHCLGPKAQLWGCSDRHRTCRSREGRGSSRASRNRPRWERNCLGVNWTKTGLAWAPKCGPLAFISYHKWAAS